MNADTLKRQSNGEDVVLQGAVDNLSKPAGSGITPSGPPTIASLSDAQAALQAGTATVEEKALERHTTVELATPGTVKSTVPLQASEPLIWIYSWCASNSATLDQNFQNIKLKFVLDGKDVTSQMGTASGQSSGQNCRAVFALLTDWPAGEHNLSITATFTSKINDGTSDYAAGDYIQEYTVYVKP